MLYLYLGWGIAAIFFILFIVVILVFLKKLGDLCGGRAIPEKELFSYIEEVFEDGGKGHQSGQSSAWMELLGCKDPIVIDRKTFTFLDILSVFNFLREKVDPARCKVAFQEFLGCSRWEGARKFQEPEPPL